MKTLVANRGEVACRIFKTLRALNMPSVAVFSDVDAQALHVGMADEAYCIGGPDGYLQSEALLAAAHKTRAKLVHPGYGFLSQSPAFARQVSEAGLIFVGPNASAIKALGDKTSAREHAHRLGIPITPGQTHVTCLSDAKNAATKVGFPVMLKAAAGGGGRGMRLAVNEQELGDAFASAQEEAHRAFNDGRLFVERAIADARHIEVQVLADGTRAYALGERECSLQRRYQKVVEETPAPRISQALRATLCDYATKLVQSVSYTGAATVEFLVSPNERAYFLEVNTRLQVEHAITEMVLGYDIVAAQLAIAVGDTLKETTYVSHGAAIEVRLNAEDVHQDFLPQTGTIVATHWPSGPGIRVDAGIGAHSIVGPHYDSLMAKIIAHGPNREQARKRLLTALDELVVLGVTTNQRFLIDILCSSAFVGAQTLTTTLKAITPTPTRCPESIFQAAQKLWHTRAQAPRLLPHNAKRGPWDFGDDFRMGACGR